MVEWWSSLSTLMKALWGITLSASLVFVIQTIMTFLGADSDFDTDFSGDFSGDVPGDISGDFAGDGADAGSGMGLLTFRNFINFMLGFGWTAVLLRGSIQSNTLLFTIAIIVGVILVILVMLLFKWLAGMQQSGNIDVYKSAIDCTGKVYLAIPGGRKGEGKVQITINNSVREYDAVTDGDTLPTGKDIRVVDVVGPNTLLVEEMNSIII